MARCDDCIHNKVCDHNIYGFENCGNYIPTDDVAPKSEDNIPLDVHEALKQRAKVEVAREIFEEIEILMKIYTFPVVQTGVVEIAKEPFWCIEPNDFAAIKKKYTEEKE